MTPTDRGDRELRPSDVPADSADVVIQLGQHGRRLVDRVHEGLMEAIRDGRLRPGQRLVLHQLADLMEVSLSPVREAVARLAQEGVVHLVPHKGAVVASPTAEEISNIYDVREALETHAITRAIERATPADIQALEQACQLAEDNAHALTLQEWFEANRKFHLQLIAPCGNRIALEVLEGLWDRQAAMSMLSAYISEESSVRRMVAEHRSMLEAVRLGRTELAQALIRSHIQDGRRTLAHQFEDPGAEGQEVRDAQ
jgi:DNA-binding GntR family transcriptional regulator